MGASQLHGLIGSYTGGHLWQTTYTNSGGLDSWDFNANGNAQPGSVAWNLTDNSGQITNNTYLDAKVTGIVTAKLTWIAATGQNYTTDPPPANVLVTEMGSASWRNGGSGAGAANDGWSDPVVNGASSGTRYLMEDGSSGTIKMPAITVEANTPGWTSLSQTNATAAASFTATGSSVTINAGNTIIDAAGHPNILIGQGCTASLTGIPANATNLTYQWSVDGTATFQSWTVSSNFTKATLVTGIGPTTNSTAHWYWIDNPTTETIRCTVQFTPPAVQGSPAPSPIPLSLTQQVILQAPTFSVTPNPGDVQINNHSPNYGNTYALYDGPGETSTRGINWAVQVNTPPAFTSQGASLWNFVQYITPTAFRTPNGGSELPSAFNGQSGLDTSYPYDPGPFSASFPGGHSADNLLWTSGDSPGFPVNDAYQSYRVLETFNTYVMYNPPGGDTQWVPLWRIDWYWTTNVAKPGSWSLWNDNNSAGIVRVTDPGTGNTLIHPQWSALVTAPPPGVF